MGVSGGDGAVPRGGWFMVGGPVEMDDLGVPLFLETPKWYTLLFRNVYISVSRL